MIRTGQIVYAKDDESCFFKIEDFPDGEIKVVGEVRRYSHEDILTKDTVGEIFDLIQSKAYLLVGEGAESYMEDMDLDRFRESLLRWFRYSASEDCLEGVEVVKDLTK